MIPYYFYSYYTFTFLFFLYFYAVKYSIVFCPHIAFLALEANIF